MSPPAFLEVSHPSSAPRARTTATNALAITVLLGITLAFYHGLWLPGLVLIKRDAYGVFLPLKQHLIERLSTGELPQWFPYDALGREPLDQMLLEREKNSVGDRKSTRL